MKRLFPLLFLAACGTYTPPCDDQNPLLPGCDRNDRGAFQPSTVEPPDPDDDPEPEHDTIDDPDYRAWRERQGRPLP